MIIFQKNTIAMHYYYILGSNHVWRPLDPTLGIWSTLMKKENPNTSFFHILYYIFLKRYQKRCQKKDAIKILKFFISVHFTK